MLSFALTFAPTPCPPGKRSYCGLAHSAAALLMTAVGVAATPAFGRVEINVTHVGFPAIGRGDIIRAGCWTPILVDLSLVDQAEFHGTLRAAQFDTDGDQCVDVVEVHLRAETGGTQRLTLYVPANPVVANNLFSVELLDSDGSTVQVVSQGVLAARAAPADVPSVVSQDDLVILSVGTGTIGKVKDLASTQPAARFRRGVSVAHINPEDLPELWIGLEAVDYIVWDDARPEELTQRRLEAMIEWVRHGGTLLIAAARSAGALKLVKPINAILPVEIGDIIPVSNLPDTREKLLGIPTAEELPTDPGKSWIQMQFPQPVPVAQCKMREDASRIVQELIPLPRGGSASSDIVSRRREQRGHVIFSAIALHDLFSAPGATNTFFERVFHFLPVADVQQTSPTPVSLFDSVVSAVGFITSRSVYLLVVAVFSIAYVTLATFGTWTFLSARGWRHYSWTAFALVAAACSVVSVLAVGSIRGIGDRLEQIAIVDGQAGEAFGRGTVFFGLKTGIEKTLDLWLPSDWLTAREPDVTSCFLRPLPAGQDWRSGAGGFVDPKEYRLKPASAQIDDVRFRATLKRFEGRWEGPLGGRMNGRIAVRKGFITEDSFVLNELGVNLKNCRLIQTQLNPGDTAAERNTVTYVYPIGDVPSDGMKVYLAARCYALIGSETLRDILQRSQLDKWQEAWSGPFLGLIPSLAFGSGSGASSALGREQDALMLVSTIGDFDPAVLGKKMGSAQTWSVDRLRQLDLREQLTAGRQENKERSTTAEPGGMVLIGFADGGGPVRLFTRSGERPYSVIQPEEHSSWCMYRIHMPFAVLEPATGDSPAPTGAPAGGSTDPSEERKRP